MKNYKFCLNNYSMKHIFLILLFVFFMSSLTACYEKPEFPNAPSISFDKIEKFTVQDAATLATKDSVILTVSFQDGDGDLGLAVGDTLAPYQFFNEDGSINFNYTNHKVKVFIQQGETFVPFELPDAELGYDGRFQPLFEEGKSNPLEGTLSRRLNFSHNTFAPNTVMKFEVQIMDRALNLSNVIETDTVVIRATP